ncbi:hypothetical protein BGZ46_001095, partial [Entomortierella lignicola]
EGALREEDGSSSGDFRLRLPGGEDMTIPLRSKLLLHLPAYSSDNPAATFRQGMRPKQKRPLEDLSAVQPEICLRLYKRACIHKIERDVQSCIETIAKRTVFKKGDTKQSLLDQEKTRLLNKLSNCVKVPRGVMDDSISSVKSKYDLSDKFTFLDLQEILGDTKENVSIWKEAVESNFSRAWSNSIAGGTPGQPEEVDEEGNDGEEEVDERNLLGHVITELSVLTHKTVLIAAGDLYGDNLDPQPSDDFDIRSILPDRFKFRCNVAPLFNVVPIPRNLEDHLESFAENSGKDDIFQLLSQPHLQFLHTEFLSSRRRAVAPDSKNTDHAIWQSAADAIQTPGADSPPTSPTGISHTITEQIRQFSTAVSNIWQGTILTRSLEYLLRILLRLHLAPTRENKYQEVVKLAIERKKAKAKKTKSHSKGLWQYKILQLCDELADLQQCNKENKEARTQAIFGQLMKLQSSKPTRQHEPLLCLEEQLGKNADPDDSEAALATIMATKAEPIVDEYLSSNQDLLEGGEELDMDDIDLIIQDNEVEAQVTKEPSRERPKALQAILKMLLESPHIYEAVDANWVRKTSHIKSDLTDNECRVVALLANELRPYVPQKRNLPESSALKNALPHLTLRAPLALIANSVMLATGYGQFTQRISPHISPAFIHGLSLNPVGIYETLCQNTENHFDITNMDGRMIADYKNITKCQANRRAVMSSLFNLKKIDEICYAHGLTFRDSVVPHGVDRAGFPFTSELEKRRKNMKNNVPSSNKWHDEFLNSKLNRDQVLFETEASIEALKLAEKEVNIVRSNVRELEKIQVAASLQVKKNEPNSYATLYGARVSVQKASKSKQQSRVYSNANSSKNTSVKFTTPTWCYPTVEDKTANVDISDLLVNSRGKSRTIVYTGTDYGL